ncbi:hypothetical protein [Nocardia jiangsuensis]|uniref:Uncharacterized protein n=1 Tax=Nocardia jiangsuensis TaxID=1691563 RepID=A0ABV8DSJ3_9NOCA
MSGPLELVCEYCAHRSRGGESRCGHCGGPLRAALDVAETTVRGAREVVKGAHEVVRNAEKVAGVVGGEWQRFVLPAVGVLFAVLCAVLVWSCSPLRSAVAPPPPVSAAQALPELLAAAATSCERADAGRRAERCVLPAGSPLLFGGLAGGRELTLHTELAAPEELAATVRRWRSAGGTVLLDGRVYAAVGPSTTVLYADSRTGLLLETSAFTGPGAARTFLNRAGLLMP